MTDYGSDKEMTVLGVPGRLTHATTYEGGRSGKASAPGLWFKQRWVSQSRPIDNWGDGARIAVEMRFDDECGNGHNTFAITADIYRVVKYNKQGNRRQDLGGGCCHEDIARIFPELAELIQWHLWSTDGGMHYAANAAFHASNRDCWGKLKGEPKNFETHIRFGNVPILHPLKANFAKFLQEYRKGVECDFDFEVLPLYHVDRPGESYKFGPKYTFGGFAERWHEGPFDSEDEAMRFLAALQHCNPVFEQVATAWGEGKERDFAAARSCANWPEATDEELSAPDLKDKLMARLPGLLERFRAAVESIGFRWEAPVMERAES